MINHISIKNSGKNCISVIFFCLLMADARCLISFLLSGITLSADYGSQYLHHSRNLVKRKVYQLKHFTFNGLYRMNIHRTCMNPDGKVLQGMVHERME